MNSKTLYQKCTSEIVHPQQELKSISVLVPLQAIEHNLSEIAFSVKGSTTIVTEGKFWKKVLYINGNETITVSEEIGDAYPKDPIITIWASDNTISKVIEGIK
jgi:hypothetical protein